MSDIGLGGVDFSLGLENFNAELLAYGQTPEGQAAFDQLRQDLGIDPSLFGGGGPPDPPALDDDEEEEVDPIAQQMQLDREFAQQQAAQQTAQRRQDARTTMAAVLDTYGLGDLSDFVYNEIIAKETVNINNPDAIIFAIREQPAYKKRFAGNAARLKAGLSELDPASYIGLENQFRQTLQSNGLPANFYDQAEDFQAFIEGDVSPSELNERVQQGYRAVADADPASKNR
jgi:hypothetical protein